MIIPKYTPIIINGKVIGAVAEDCTVAEGCTDERKVIPVNVFLMHFEMEKFQNMYGEEELHALIATLSVPPTRDEIF